jgi:hypothetical protein
MSAHDPPDTSNLTRLRLGSVFTGAQVRVAAECFTACFALCFCDQE